MKVCNKEETCEGCTDRSIEPNCHDTCEGYIKRQAEARRKKKEQHKDSQYYAYMDKVMRKKGKKFER